ncbi:Integral membrane protein TerC [Acidisarcina polymorpha]|uniref:Integral membrane protein TerC n=1 Tax=Acidisarcina polymorpha TaxID=2211140 RepID=A0A2Z5FWY6_9BACT|nr:TerC/Alx family metal homeostasis membrane protein [Acidisarcina polymorpha]AXC11388.1 Integral membrane protein TerC [Acidisarcina polymorpha]
MLAGAPLSYWIGFHALVLALLAIDLLFLNPKNEKRAQKLAWGWTLFLFCLACAFALTLVRVDGHQHALEFFSSYLIESSLSVDNLFVFLLMFRSLQLDRQQQHSILLWGVGGAIVMRALFIAAGVTLLAHFAWIEDVFGVILLIAAVRLIRHQANNEKPSAVVRWIQSQSLKRAAKAAEGEGRKNDGPAKGGRGRPSAGNVEAAVQPQTTAAPLRAAQHQVTLTPATFVMIVLAVEGTDLVFALDSIPAVLAITRDPFIAYTSNIFAVLGLRSLYFALAGMLDRFRLLHYGLAAILGFVALKMLLARWVHVNVVISLAVILGILAIFIAASLLEEKRRRAHA